MPPRSLSFAAALASVGLAGALLASCAPGGTDSPSGCQLVAGDLVITEVMANPFMADDGSEWFEIYNASGAPLDLNGVTLISSKEDGSLEKTHRMRLDTPLPAGNYLVIGGVDDELKPDFVDYGLGTALGDLRNAGGRLAVSCGDDLVDEAIYVTSADGVSQGFSGGRSPDSVGNDDPTAWCDATQEFATEQFGSPGQANEPCAGQGAPGKCLDNGVERDTVPPVERDLIITEIMPNPKGTVAGTDATGEWFEVYVANDVDLNGLELGNVVGTVKTTLASEECIHATAGTFMVFAHNDDETLNGGLPQVDALFPSSLAFSNSGGGLFLSIGGVLLDYIPYNSPTDGASWAINPAKSSITENDDVLNWCKGTKDFSGGNLGSPGEENPACPTQVPAGMCLPAGGGAARAIVAPAAGQLVINEVAPNPIGGDTGSDKEWFEVYVTANVDLNGLQVANEGTGKTVLADPNCLSATAGSYVLFAQDKDEKVNGGLANVDHVFNFTLANSGARSLSIGPPGGPPLDIINRTVTTADGKVWNLEPESRTAAANDSADPAVGGPWCDVAAPGTPKAANAQCP